MWILTSDGYVNSDHVVEIKGAHKGSVLHLVNGKTVVVRQDDYDLAYGLNPVIPAQPGFEVLYLYEPGDEPPFGRDPVIAWRIDADAHSSQIAVTPAGSSLGSQRIAILYPDGQVYVPEESTYPNIEAWIAAERDAQAAQKPVACATVA
jgi:hypothetical protein